MPLFPYIDKEKSFLHNFQLALMESIDFDNQEENLVSVNHTLVKVFFILARHYSYWFPKT